MASANHRINAAVSKTLPGRGHQLGIGRDAAPSQPFGQPVDYPRPYRMVREAPLDIRVRALRNDLLLNAPRREPLFRLEHIAAAWIIGLSVLTIGYFAWQQFVR